MGPKIFKPVIIDGIESSRYVINCEGVVINKETGYILKHHVDIKGYETVSLALPIPDLLGKCKVKFKKVHRLVAERFIPNPYNKKEVNHINGNKSDNHVINLEWVTPSENCIHAVTHGLKPDVQLTVDQVKRICEMIETNEFSLKNIAKICGVKDCIVNDIKCRNTWKYISKDYTFPPIISPNRGAVRYYDKIDKLIMAGLSNTEIAKRVPIHNIKRSSYLAAIARRRKIINN